MGRQISRAGRERPGPFRPEAARSAARPSRKVRALDTVQNRSRSRRKHTANASRQSASDSDGSPGRRSGTKAKFFARTRPEWMPARWQAASASQVGSPGSMRPSGSAPLHAGGRGSRRGCAVPSSRPATAGLPARPPRAPASRPAGFRRASRRARRCGPLLRPNPSGPRWPSFQMLAQAMNRVGKRAVSPARGALPGRRYRVSHFDAAF
jgi:hypothetical protein